MRGGGGPARVNPALHVILQRLHAKREAFGGGPGKPRLRRGKHALHHRLRVFHCMLRGFRRALRKGRLLRSGLICRGGYRRAAPCLCHQFLFVLLHGGGRHLGSCVFHWVNHSFLGTVLLLLYYARMRLVNKIFLHFAAEHCIL